VAKASKGAIGSYSRGKLVKIIDDRAAGLVAGGEANQNAFSTVIVKGENGAVSGTLAADSTTDTLNIVGGDNITLTADTGTDTVTISLDSSYQPGSSNPGGSSTQVQFNDGGTLGGDSGLTYNKATDTLSATKLSASNGLAVTGDASLDSLSVTNDATFSGDVTLGNTTADITTVTGKLTASNGISVTGDASLDSLTVSNDASFSGDVTLGTATFSGDVTLGNAATDITTVTGKLTASNGLDVTGDASLDSLTVSNNTTLSGDVTLGNAAADITTVTGKLTASNGLLVTGDVSFDDASFTGDVTLGNAATDVTTVTGQLTASNGISISGDVSFDNLTMAGSVTASNGINISAGDLIIVENIEVTGNLVVNDDVTLGNSPQDIITINGEFTASNGLDTTSITATSISSSGDLQVGGTSDFDGNVVMDNQLTISGMTRALGALTASSGINVINHMLADDGIVTVSGKLTASNGLTVTGDASFDDATFTGDVDFRSDITLGSDSADTTTVLSALTASAGLDVSDTGITTTSISSSADLQVGGTADFDGSVTMDNSLTILGQTRLQDLTASSGVAITGGLKVKDEAEFASELSGTTIRAQAIYINDDLVTSGVDTSGNNTWTGTNTFSNKLTASNGISVTNYLVATNDSIRVTAPLTGTAGMTMTGSLKVKDEAEFASELSGTTIRAQAIYINDDLVTSGVDTSGNNTWTGTNTFSNKLTASNGLATTDISASSDLLVGSTIKAENIGTDTDDTVVIQNSTGYLKTQEIDTRVWGSTLVDAANGADNRLATFSDSNSLNGEANLTYDGSTLKLTGTLEVTDSAYINFLSSSDVDIDGGSIDNVVIGGTTPAAGTFSTATITNLISLGTASLQTVTASNGLTVSGSLHAADEAEFAGELSGTVIRATAIYINDDAVTAGAGGGGEANQNAFSTFSVSGQSNVVADSTTDTVTLAAGNNMIITTDAATDTITLTATGGSGGGDVSVYGTPVDNQVAVWKNSGSIEGDGSLTWNGTTLDVVGHTEMDTFAASGNCEIVGRFDIDGNAHIDGNLVVRDIIYAHTFQVSSSDNPFLSSSVQNSILTALTQSYLVLAEGSTGSVNDVGIIMERGGETNRAIFFDESTDEFAFVGTNANEATDGEITILDYTPVRMGTATVTSITASNGVQVTGSFKVYGNTEISGGYIGVGVSEEDLTHAITLPNNSDASGQAKANAFVTYSSLRYKSDIKEIENPLEKIAQLRGVTYNWKDSGRPDVGLIAEEVGKVFPEVVSYEPNGKDAFGIDYSKLTSLLLASVKAQQNMIETQNEKISRLEKQLEKILK